MCIAYISSICITYRHLITQIDLWYWPFHYIGWGIHITYHPPNVTHYHHRLLVSLGYRLSTGSLMSTWLRCFFDVWVAPNNSFCTTTLASVIYSKDHRLDNSHNRINLPALDILACASAYGARWKISCIATCSHQLSLAGVEVCLYGCNRYRFGFTLKYVMARTIITNRSHSTQENVGLHCILQCVFRYIPTVPQ
jgi:hypothetical protein